MAVDAAVRRCLADRILVCLDGRIPVCSAARDLVCSAVRDPAGKVVARIQVDCLVAHSRVC